MPKAFSRLHHIKRPNSPRGPEPMDADLQGGTVYFTVAQLEGIRRGCTAKAAHKTGASKRPHSNFCPRNRLLAAGQQFTPATTAKGPGARAKADAGAVPTVVVVVEQGDARLSPRPSEGGVFVCTDGSTTATQGQPEAGPAEAVARHVVFRPAAPPGPMNSLTLLRAPTAEDQPRGRGVQYSPLKASASARLSARPNEDTAMAPFDPAKASASAHLLAQSKAMAPCDAAKALESSARSARPKDDTEMPPFDAPEALDEAAPAARTPPSVPPIKCFYSRRLQREASNLEGRSSSLVDKLQGAHRRRVREGSFVVHQLQFQAAVLRRDLLLLIAEPLMKRSSVSSSATAAAYFGQRVVRLLDALLVSREVAGAPKFLPVPMYKVVFEAIEQADMTSAGVGDNTEFFSAELRCPSPRAENCPLAEEHRYQMSGHVTSKFSVVVQDWAYVGVQNPPAPCCGSRDTRPRASRRLRADGSPYSRAYSAFDTNRSGVHLILNNSAIPIVSTSAIYAVITHESTCGRIGKSGDYFDADDARLLRFMPEGLKAVLHTNMQGMVGTIFAARDFERRCDVATIEGGDTFAGQASKSEMELQEIMADGSHRFAGQVSQYWQLLQRDCNDSVWETLVMSDSCIDPVLLRRRLAYNELNALSPGRRFLPLEQLAITLPKPSQVAKILEAGSFAKKDIWRREICSELPKGPNVTGDHVKSVAQKALLKGGGDDDVRLRQCYHLVDCARGTLLGGVLVPGTRMPLLDKFFADLRKRGAVYKRAFVDNAPVGAVQFESIGCSQVLQGTGHLVRAVTSSTNPGCELNSAHGEAIGKILRDKCSAREELLRSKLLTRGGLPPGTKLLVSRGVSKTWRSGDCITCEQLGEMERSGLYASQFKKNRKAVGLPMSVKSLRASEHARIWNPPLRQQELCPECKKPIRGSSNARRCGKNCTTWTATTPGKFSNFICRMEKHHDEEDLEISITEYNDRKGCPVETCITGENGSERSHISLQNGLLGQRYGMETHNYICHGRAVRHNRRLHLNHLRRLASGSPLPAVRSKASAELNGTRSFQRSWIALKTNAEARACGMEVPYPYERPLRPLAECVGLYGDYWKALFQDREACDDGDVEDDEGLSSSDADDDDGGGGGGGGPDAAARGAGSSGWRKADVILEAAVLPIITDTPDRLFAQQRLLANVGSTAFSQPRPPQRQQVPQASEHLFFWPASVPLKSFLARVDGKDGARVVDIEAIKKTDVGKQAFPCPCAQAWSFARKQWERPRKHTRADCLHRFALQTNGGAHKHCDYTISSKRKFGN